MIAAIVALFSKFGLGWLFSWVSGGLFTSLGGLIVAAGTQLIELIGIVLQWLVRTFIQGIDHIVKSVPAILVVLTVAWSSWGYATFVRPAEVRVITERVEVPAQPGTERPNRSIVEDLFGTTWN